MVSAMLITPAAAAYLLTDRLRRMLVIASAIGAVTGVAGCFLSFLGNSLPTGPMMVLATSAVFAAAFLFAPRHGLAVRWAAARARQRLVFPGPGLGPQIEREGGDEDAEDEGDAAAAGGGRGVGRDHAGRAAYPGGDCGSNRVRARSALAQEVEEGGTAAGRPAGARPGEAAAAARDPLVHRLT